MLIPVIITKWIPVALDLEEDVIFVLTPVPSIAPVRAVILQARTEPNDRLNLSKYISKGASHAYSR